MPFNLLLPEPWRSRGWKVKIAEKERVEPPHVTIIHRSCRWRLGLRDGRFHDEDPDPAEVPRDLVTLVKDELGVLRARWDEMYPHNPVSSRKKEECEDERQGPAAR